MTDDDDKHNRVTSLKLTSLDNTFSARYASFDTLGLVKKFSPAGQHIHYTLIFDTKDRKVKCHCARREVLAGSEGKDLDGGESVSCPARFAPWEIPWYLLSRGLGGLYSRSGLPCPESNDDSWVVHIRETVGKKETLIFSSVFQFWSPF